MRSMLFIQDSESSYVMENLLHKGETLLFIVDDTDMDTDKCNKTIFELVSTINRIYGKTVDIIDFEFKTNTYFKKGTDRIYESFLKSLISRDPAKEVVHIVDFEKLLSEVFNVASTVTPISTILAEVKSLGVSIIGHIASSSAKKLFKDIDVEHGVITDIVDTVVTLTVEDDETINGEYAYISSNFIPKHKKIILQP